jgi:hypothetical protein
MGARHPSHAIAAVVCLLVLVLDVCNAQPGDVAAVVAPSVTTSFGTAPRTPAYSTSIVCDRLPNGNQVACNAFYSSLRGTNRAGVLYARLTWENEYPASCEHLGTVGYTMQEELQPWRPRQASNRTCVRTHMHETQVSPTGHAFPAS